MEIRPTSSPALVLLVDDQEPIRVALAALLEAEGYAVICAASGREALALCAVHHVDMTVCDIRLHDMSGIELLHRIEVARPELPAVLISGYSDRLPPLPRNRRFLEKPLILEELTEAIESLLASLPEAAAP